MKTFKIRKEVSEEEYQRYLWEEWKSVACKSNEIGSIMQNPIDMIGSMETRQEAVRQWKEDVQRLINKITDLEKETSAYLEEKTFLGPMND